MVDTDIKITGVIGLVMLLVGFGGSMLLSNDEFENAYVCTSNEKIGICTGNEKHPEPLSSTSKTCYYVLDGEPKYSPCVNGVWKSLKAYAKEKGIDPLSFLISSETDEKLLEQPKNSQIFSKKWLCDPEKCSPAE